MARKRPRLSSSAATTTSATSPEQAPTPDTEPVQRHQRQKPLPKDVRLQAVPGSSPGRVSFVRAPGTAVIAAGTTTASHRERDDLLARLNFSAADERRKALLERLRAIDKTRSDLAAKAAVAAAAVAAAAAAPATAGPGHAIDDESGTHKHIDEDAPATTAATAAATPLSTAEMALPTSPTDTCPLLDCGGTRTGMHSPSSPTSVCVCATASAATPHAAPQNDLASTAPPSAPPSPAGPTRTTLCAASPLCPTSAVSAPDNPSGDGVADAHGHPSTHHLPGLPNTAQSSTPSTSSSPPPCLGRRTSRSRVRSIMISAMPGETGLSSFSGISKCKSLAFARKLMNAIIRKPTARPFSAPVKDLWSPSAIPRYFDVIAHPMDLGTIKRRVDGTHYLTRVPIAPLLELKPLSVESPALLSNLSFTAPTAAASGFIFDLAAFCEDVRLCFRNCMVYCPEQDVLFRCAQALMEEFDGEVLDAPRPAPIFPEGSMKKLLKDKKCTKEKVKVKVPPTRTRKSSCSTRTTPKARVVSNRVAGGKRVKSKGQGKFSDAKSCNASRSGAGPNGRSADKVQALSVRVDSDALALEERLEYLHRCRATITGHDHVVGVEDMQMSFEEKSRLSTRLSAVPVDKVCQLVAILSSAVSKGNSVSETDEMEIDMDKLDVMTLRKVEEFVDSCVDPKIGGKPKSRKSHKSVDLTDFEGIVEIDGEIAALTAQLQQVKAAAGTSRPGGLWDDSSSSESDGSSGGSCSGDSDSSDESDDSDAE